MEIVLSVIIPMFKGKKYIKSTVEQVKKIEIDKEIIIVNDGSPDDSYDYCLKLYDLDDEVVIINKENGGIASARNVGLESAHGRYVLFIDQDDCISPIAVKNSIDYMLNNDLDMIFWSTEFRSANGETSICDEVYQEGIITREQIIDEVMPSFIMSRQNKYISYLGHIWGGVVSKKIIENNNLSFRYFIDYEDDYLFVFDCLLVAHKIGFKKNTGYYWTVNEKSYSHSKRLNCNYINKSERMYDYINQKIKNIPISNNNMESIIIYEKQRTILNALRNACSSGFSKVELGSIKKALKSDLYKESMNKPLEVMEDTRFKLVYFLIKYNLFSLAVLIIRAYYFLKR